MPKVWFASPGDPETLTGGYLYNWQVMARLADHGWLVVPVRLSDAFPFPRAEDQAAAARAFNAVDGDDVVVIDGLALGAMTADVLAPLKGRLVALVHHPLADESGLSPDRAAALLQSERQALTFAERVLVTSPFTASTLMARFDVPEARIVVAEPGVVRPEQAAQPEDPPLILSVGSLTVRKGHDVLLEALHQVRDLVWSATIVGSPDHDPAVAADVAARCRRLDLDARVTLAGARSPEALPTYYGAAMLFALATRYEGYGMVFSEAMVHGLPIVSCAAGAVPRTVPSDAGVLVPPDDAPAFAAALRRMLTDEPFRLATAAAAAAAGRALPTWDETARRFAAALDAVQCA